MQEGRNMSKLVKFVYAVIMLVTLFLFTTEVDSGVLCNGDVDCPQTICNRFSNFNPRCNLGYCICVRMMT